MSQADERLRALEQLREELILGGRSHELEALDQLLRSARAEAATTTSEQQWTPGTASATGGATQQGGTKRPAAAGTSGSKPKTYLKLKKKYYTPAEVAKRVGVSRQTVVKWIERGELEAELTPGGHHRIPASVFHREGRGESVQLIPVDEE
jgi:excisionase family DNA binding protein